MSVGVSFPARFTLSHLPRKLPAGSPPTIIHALSKPTSRVSALSLHQWTQQTPMHAHGTSPIYFVGMCRKFTPLSHISYSLPLCRGQKATRQQQLSFILSLSADFSPHSDFFFFSAPNKQAAAPSIIFPSLREQSIKHELSPPCVLAFPTT